MLGAIAGDVIGSVYEASPVKKTDFDLFPPGAGFTDDTVLTVATAEVLIGDANYDLGHGDVVIAAITSGPHGRVAVTYVEWAGPGTQFQVVPWTLIDGLKSAERFAGGLRQARIHRGGETSISMGLVFSSALFENSPFRAARRVIDRERAHAWLIARSASIRHPSTPGARITILYEGPAGARHVRHVLTDDRGGYADIFDTDVPGEWTVRVVWPAT